MASEKLRSVIHFLVIVFIFSHIPVLVHGETAEKENYDRVLKAFSAMSVSPEERSLLADFGNFSSSLLVRSRDSSGVNREQGTFVFAVPLDAEFAVDTALSLTKLIKEKGSAVNILVAFLGGEKIKLPYDLPASSGTNMPTTSYSGLRDLLTLTDLPENWVLCYFDAAQSPESLVLRHGGQGYLAPLGIIKPLPALFRSFKIPWSFAIRFNSIYKLGLVEGPEALAIAWQEEVNCFILSGEKTGRGKTLTPEILSELMLNYAASLNFPILSPDRHYSFIPLPNGGFFFVTEGLTAAILLSVVAIFLFLYLLYSARNNAILVYHFRLIIKNFWFFILPLPLLVICLKVSALMYYLLLKIFNAPLAAANYAGFVLSLFLSMFVFFLPLAALDRLHFPQRGRFYGFAALIFCVSGILSAALLDFAYVPFFIWSFVFISTGALVSNSILIFIFSLLAPILAVLAFFNIFETGSTRLAELFIFSHWQAKEGWAVTIYVALLILPVLFLILRGVILFQKSFTINISLNKKIRLIALFVLAVTFILAMAAQILVYKLTNPAEKRFITEISGAEVNDDMLALIIDDIVFQDSRILTMELFTGGSPVRFDVFLESIDDKTLLPVYSAPVPFERTDDGKTIVFALGEEPANPFTMEIVLPLDFEGFLKATAIYNDSANDFLIVSKRASLEATTGIRH
jgi:hypothetical protein